MESSKEVINSSDKLARLRSIFDEISLHPEVAGFSTSAEASEDQKTDVKEQQYLAEKRLLLAGFKTFLETECSGDVNVFLDVVEKFLANASLQLRSFFDSVFSHPPIQNAIRQGTDGTLDRQGMVSLHDSIQNEFLEQQALLPTPMPFLTSEDFKTEAGLHPLCFTRCFSKIVKVLEEMFKERTLVPAHFTRIQQNFAYLGHDLPNDRLGRAIHFLEILKEGSAAEQTGLDEKKFSILSREINTLEAGVEKISACLEMLAFRSDREYQLEKRGCDLRRLLTLDRSDLGTRFPYSYRIIAEDNVPDSVMVSPTALLLIIDNISKNAFKIMADKKRPRECGVTWKVFVRSGVLFLECSDEGHGIDLSEILVKAAQRAIQAIRQDTVQLLNPVIQRVARGAWSMSDRDAGLSLHDVFDLIFEEYITARDGGSGLGLAESRQLVGMHGGSISATNGVAGRGAKILLGIPLQDTGPKEFREILQSAKTELDKKEMAAVQGVAA